MNKEIREAFCDRCDKRFPEDLMPKIRSSNQLCLYLRFCTNCAIKAAEEFVDEIREKIEQSKC